VIVGNHEDKGEAGMDNGDGLVIPQDHPGNRSERGRRHIPNSVNQGIDELIRLSEERGFSFHVYGIFLNDRLERGGRSRR